MRWRRRGRWIMRTLAACSERLAKVAVAVSDAMLVDDKGVMCRLAFCINVRAMVLESVDFSVKLRLFLLGGNFLLAVTVCVCRCLGNLLRITFDAVCVHVFQCGAP